MLVEAGDGHHSEHNPICFAYTRDRIAVSLPGHGVKLWLWDTGKPAAKPVRIPLSIMHETD